MENESSNTKPGMDLILPLPEVRPINERPAKFLNLVDELMSKLWPDADWRKYLDAITNKSAITGKWEVDRGFAARRIQEEAEKAGLIEVATAKLAKIMRAIETLLRRDDLDRKSRLELAVQAPPAAAE
jgi:hypothetical protein